MGCIAGTPGAEDVSSMNDARGMWHIDGKCSLHSDEVWHLLCLQSDASLQSAQLAQETLSEPDWSRVMQPKDEEEPALRSVSNSQVSSPHMVQPSQESKNHQEWIRLMQQREAEVQHREVPPSPSLLRPQAWQPACWVSPCRGRVLHINSEGRCCVPRDVR
jgi:hypothetical protein